MDTPRQDAVALTGLVCGGAQVCIFATSEGTPLGNALAPVVKVTADAATASHMADHIDFTAAPVPDADDRAAEGRALFELLIEVCSGRQTSAEIIGHQEFALHRVAPTV
jgi:altronate dehydratase large subunit